MKIISRILYTIAGLFALLCIGVLVFAFNPDLTQKTADFLYKGNNKVTEKENNSSDLSSEPTGFGEKEESGRTSITIEFKDPLEDGVTNPYPEDKRYIIPQDTDLVVPDKVAGRTGYIPLTHDAEEISQSRESIGTGETGSDLSFDTNIYPYYGMLNDKLKNVYKQVYANATALIANFSPVENISASQVSLVFEAVYNDHPELFWLDTSYSGTYLADGSCLELKLKFNQTALDIDNCKNSFTKKANEIITGALKYTSAYEKEIFVHDTLLAKLEYQLSAPLNQSAYSALVNGKTVCAGYARAFQYVMQQLGIPCYYCTGYAGESHAWNIVRMGEHYYNVDLTWDDLDIKSYDYFNRTDTYFSKTHIRQDLSVYLPACLGTTYEGKKTIKKTDTSNKAQDGKEEEDEEPEELTVSGSDAQYKGETLKTLADYYTNCYNQMIKGPDGTVLFQNIVSEAVLNQIYEASEKETYNAGYMDTFLKKTKKKSGKITIKVEKNADGTYFLSHEVTTS